LGDRLQVRSKPFLATQREKKNGLEDLVTRNWKVSICLGRSQARSFGMGRVFEAGFSEFGIGVHKGAEFKYLVAL
jgi:hypothetical protein